MQKEQFELYQDEYSNFSKSEIDCNCSECGHELWDSSYGDEMPEYFLESMRALQALREAYGKPMRINSAHRCTSHNSNVGGASKSRHLKLAFDVSVPKKEQSRFIELAKEHGFLGIGKYNSFVHIDMLRDYLTEWNG